MRGVWRWVLRETRPCQTLQSKRTAQRNVCAVSKTENALVRNSVYRNLEVVQNIGTDLSHWTNCVPSSRGRNNFVRIWYNKVIKWIIRKQILSSLNGYTWFCIMSSQGFCESGNQLTGCLKDPELLGRLSEWPKKEFLRHWFGWLKLAKWNNVWLLQLKWSHHSRQCEFHIWGSSLQLCWKSRSSKIWCHLGYWIITDVLENLVTSCVHLFWLPWRWRQQTSPKRRKLFTKLQTSYLRRVVS